MQAVKNVVNNSRERDKECRNVLVSSVAAVLASGPGGGIRNKLEVLLLLLLRCKRTPRQGTQVEFSKIDA